MISGIAISRTQASSLKHRCVPLQLSFIGMSEEDPKPGTSKDSSSFMDFDDVGEGSDDHESNVSIQVLVETTGTFCMDQ